MLPAAPGDSDPGATGAGDSGPEQRRGPGRPRKRKAGDEKAPPGSIRHARQSAAAMAAAREASTDINANAHTKSTVQLHANGFIHSRMTRARLMHTLICRLVGECCVCCVTSQAVSWLPTGSMLRHLTSSAICYCVRACGKILVPSHCLTNCNVRWHVAD